MTAKTLAVAALAALLAWPTMAAAESRSEEDVTPVSLSVKADAIAVIQRVETGAKPNQAEARVRIVEAVAGEVESGTTITVATRTLYGGIKVPEESQSLLFLRRDGEGWRPLAGQLGVWDISSGRQGTATLNLVRSVAAAARTDDKPQDAATLRRALVTGIAEATPTARAGAAMDLWMRPDLTASLDEEQAATLLRTFETLSNRERTKAHLARVLGRSGVAAAGPALVAAITGPRGEVIRFAAGEGLGLLGDEKAIRSLAERAATQDIRMRHRVASALASTRHEAARPSLESLLSDGEPAVRGEAAVGLGRLRSAAPAKALLRRFEGENAESDAKVRRALAWALAQCDEDGAWAALRRAAASDEDEGFREFVRETLRNPRRGFRL